MAYRYILLLLALNNIALTGMDIYDNPNMTILYPLPLEINKQIYSYIKPSMQWWYLNKTYNQDESIHFITFDSFGKLFATTTSQSFYNTIHIFDMNTNQKISSLKRDELHAIHSGYFDQSNNLFITACSRKVGTFNINTKEYRSQNYDGLIDLLYFNTTGTLVAQCIWAGDHRKLELYNTKDNQLIYKGNHYPYISSIKFNPSEEHIAINSHSQTDIVNLKTKTINKIIHQDTYTEINFDASGNYIITVPNKYSFILDKNNNTIIALIGHDYHVNSISCDPLGNCLAIASPRTVYFFNKYDTYDLPQLQLKYALLYWLLIEKPDKKINTIDLLLAAVAKKHITWHDKALTDQEEYNKLTYIWFTFPNNMQSAIFNTMRNKIIKFGKD